MQAKGIRNTRAKCSTMRSSLFPGSRIVKQSGPWREMLSALACVLCSGTWLLMRSSCSAL